MLIDFDRQGLLPLDALPLVKNTTSFPRMADQFSRSVCMGEYTRSLVGHVYYFLDVLSIED